MGLDCGLADDPGYYKLIVYSVGESFSGYYMKNTDTTEINGTETSVGSNLYKYEADLGTFTSFEVSVTGVINFTSSLNVYLYEDDYQIKHYSDSINGDGDVVSIDFYYEPGSEVPAE
jgi:hypothetical protein